MVSIWISHLFVPTNASPSDHVFPPGIQITNGGCNWVTGFSHWLSFLLWVICSQENEERFWLCWRIVMIPRGKPCTLLDLCLTLQIKDCFCSMYLGPAWIETVLAAFDDVMRKALSDLVGSSLSDWKGLPPKFSGRSESVSGPPLCSCYLYWFPIPVQVTHEWHPRPFLLRVFSPPSMHFCPCCCSC